MNQGHSAAWEQSWEQAAIFYRQAVDEFPDNPTALTSLGLALFELHRLEDALQFYAQAAKLNPQDPLPLEKISQIFTSRGDVAHARQAALQAAEAYLRNRDIAKAIENWQRVISLQPENVQAHTRLALVFERLGRKREAVLEYVALASIYQKAGDGQKAMRSIDQALEILPTSPEALDAQTMLQGGRQIPLASSSRPTGSSKLKSDTQPVTTSGKDAPPPAVDPVTDARQHSLAELATILFEMADDEGRDYPSRHGFQAIVRGASSRFSKSVDHTRIQLHLGQVIELEVRNDLNQAAVELERAIEAGLEHPAGYYLLGHSLTQIGRTEHGIRYLQAAVQSPGYELGGRLLLGKAYASLGNMKEASIEYLQALGLADASLLSDEQADLMRAQYEPLIEAQLQESNPESFKRICENVPGLLLQPNWKHELQRARQQLGATSADGAAVTLAEVLTQARSSQIVVSITQAHLYEKEGYLRSAMEEALFALSYAPAYLPLHSFIAELLLKQGKVDEALQKFLVLAQAYSTRGEGRRAVQIYKRVIEMAPMELSARQHLIQQLSLMGQHEDALKEHISLAEVYYSLADLEKARKTYQEAQRVAQNSRNQRTWMVRILHRIADIDLQSLDWREALRVYEQVRSLDPDDEKARISLVQLNARLGQEVRAIGEMDNYLAYLAGRNQNDLILKFLDTLLREDPHRPWVRRRLAEIYQARGKTAEAIAQYDTLGEMLIDSGDISGAKQAIEAILALKPTNASEYQQLLDQLRHRA
jgi:tetratricopeptide (TPR) repeat protein